MYECLVDIFVLPSAVPPLSCFLFVSLCIDMWVFVCVWVYVFVWVFHPWRDEKSRTICYAAVGHNRQHYSTIRIAQWPKASWRFIWTWLVSCQIDTVPEAKKLLHNCFSLACKSVSLFFCLFCCTIGQLSLELWFDQSRAFLEEWKNNSAPSCSTAALGLDFQNMKLNAYL